MNTENEIYSTTVAPITGEHHRNDHAQIFPLQNKDLLLVWSEYYVRSPSIIGRLPYDEGLSMDNAPCQITGRISSDGGRTWSGRITVQENIGRDCYFESRSLIASIMFEAIPLGRENDFQKYHLFSPFSPVFLRL